MRPREQYRWSLAGSAADISADAAATADDRFAPPTDAAEGKVPPITGTTVNTAVPSAEAGALVAPPIDAVGETVPPVAGAAAGTAADAAPADDAGASTTLFNDTAGKRRVQVTAAAAGAAAASPTVIGADCYGPSAVDDAVCFGGCCRCPSDREKISISISSD